MSTLLKLILTIIGIIILVVAIGFTALYIYGQTHIMDGGDMTRAVLLKEISYSLSGNELGGHYILSAKVDGDHAIITEEKQESFDSEIITETYKVDKDIMYQLEDVVYNYKMYAWGDREDANDVVYELDGDTATVSMVYGEDEKNYWFTEYKPKTDDERNAFWSIKKMMMEAAGIE